MPLPLETRHPDLYADARDAHEASQQACTVARDLASTAMSTTNPVNLLAQVTEARRRAGELPGQSGLDAISNPEIRTRFKEDYATYRRIFAGGGIAMPTPEELSELSNGDINWIRLAELKEAHPDHDLVVTPLTLPFDAVRQFVAAVANDKSIPNNPLSPYDQTKTNSDGLWVNEDIVDAWSQIMQNTKSRWQLPVVDTELQWTAFLLPSSNESDRLKISHAQMTQQGITTTPVVGYLAYQMNRIRQDLPPVNASTYTWAAGEFTSAKGAARFPFVYWLFDLGQVAVGWGVVDFSYAGLGVRFPVG